MNLGTLHSKEKQTFRLVVVLRSRANAHDVVRPKITVIVGFNSMGACQYLDGSCRKSLDFVV